MNYIISDSLVRLLAKGDASKLSEILDLHEVSRGLIHKLGIDISIGNQPLCSVSGSMRANEIVYHIGLFLPHDSVVRDVATCGHLGKYLNRLIVFQKTNDHRVFGLPHRIFDEVSWKERAETMKMSVTHAIDPDLLTKEEVMIMLKNEGVAHS